MQRSMAGDAERVSRVLVLGATGAIGSSLLSALLARGDSVLALSRSVQPQASGITWLRADLGDARPLAQCTGCDALVSAGPLDLAVRWLSAQHWAPPRVVAFGSTSVHSKQSSCDAGERALALRLRTAEDALLAWARQHGSAVTLLRPTLVYGAAMDRNLSRLAQLARRLGWIAIPARAHGRRQPVHAADLAGTALNALALVRTPRPAYDLAGGETLAYRDMVARVLEALPRRPLLLELPLPLLRAALALAHRHGRLRDVHLATLLRTRADLVFDDAAARTDLGHAPRMFTVSADMLQQAMLHHGAMSARDAAAAAPEWRSSA